MVEGREALGREGFSFGETLGRREALRGTAVGEVGILGRWEEGLRAEAPYSVLGVVAFCF